jgi:osmotically-inducible protein OsmY
MDDETRKRHMKRTGGTLALLCVLVAGTVGCAAAGDEAGPAATRAVDDTRITAGVKAAIAAEPALREAEIDVATSQGIVRLSGFVSSAEDVATAAAVARTVTGVQSVRNDLRLK